MRIVVHVCACVCRCDPSPCTSRPPPPNPWHRRSGRPSNALRFQSQAAVHMYMPWVARPPKFGIMVVAVGFSNLWPLQQVIWLGVHIAFACHLPSPSEMAAPSPTASRCVSVPTETESEEGRGVSADTCDVLAPQAMPLGLAACAVATESESSSPCKSRTRRRKVAKPAARPLGQASSPAVEIRTDSSSPSGAEGQAHRKRSKRPRRPQARSSSSQAPENNLAMDNKPVSSGCFDFVTWLVSERLAHTELATLSHKSPLRLGSMCSGMATEELALAALHDALLVSGLPAQPHVSVFKAERDPRKVQFLRSRLPLDTPIFIDNARLADAMPETVAGKCVERPRCDVLVCGLVCKDISGLSRTPRPISGAGQSGQALQGLLSALRGMPFEERPRLVCLECVARLGSSRHVDQDDRPGTEFVSIELRALGYVGKWFRVKPRNFFLPQSRARVYSIHLKVADFSEEGVASRKADLAVASAILSRLQTTEMESLEAMLGRLPVVPVPTARSGVVCARKGKKWPAGHAAFADTHGMSPEERQPPPDFVNTVGPLTSARGLEAMWLKVALWCRSNGKDWRQQLLVLPHGHSVTFATVQSNLFPCVTPTHDHIVLHCGRARKAGAYTALALQGVQAKEVRRWRLAQEEEALLRDLAGNAFTANIIAAVLIAGMLLM